jgi:hypothetical protein
MNRFEPPTVPLVRSRATARSIATLMLGTAVLVAGCSVRSQPDSARRSSRATAAASTDGRTPAAQYLAIAMAGNDRLEIDFDRLSGRDRDHLTNARADLRDASVTERLFDRRLLMISFPSAVEMIAEELYTANESRAELTAKVAISSTLGQLRGYEARLSAVNGPVEDEVRLIRGSLQLPPPTTS